MGKLSKPRPRLPFGWVVMGNSHGWPLLANLAVSRQYQTSKRRRLPPILLLVQQDNRATPCMGVESPLDFHQKKNLGLMGPENKPWSLFDCCLLSLLSSLSSSSLSSSSLLFSQNMRIHHGLCLIVAYYHCRRCCCHHHPPRCPCQKIEFSWQVNPKKWASTNLCFEKSEHRQFCVHEGASKKGPSTIFFLNEKNQMAKHLSASVW